MNNLVVVAKVGKIGVFDINKFPQSFSTFLIEFLLDLKIKVHVKGRKFSLFVTVA